METKEIFDTSFGGFCKQLDSALSEGWKFDFDNNLRYPEAFGTSYKAILVKVEKVDKSKKPKD